MRRFIITAVLSAGLLLAAPFSPKAGAAPPEQIHFQKINEDCNQTYTSTAGHWDSNFNPSMANAYLHDFGHDACGRLLDVNAGVDRF